MQCHASMDVVIGVRIMLLSPRNHVQSTILNFPLRVQILNLLSCCSNSSSLFPEVILCTLLHLENTSFEVWNLQTLQRCGAGKNRQGTVGEGLFNGTESSCGPVEDTNHQFHVFFKHHCSNRKDKLLSDATLLCVIVVDMQRHNCECFLAAAVVVERKHAI